MSESKRPAKTPAMLGALLLASAAAAPRVTTKGTQFVDSASGEPVVLVGANVSRAPSAPSAGLRD